jgi:diguanylate cyclase (GGDEF)-like protein/PAS domain S-box-containing protein
MLRQLVEETDVAAIAVERANHSLQAGTPKGAVKPVQREIRVPDAAGRVSTELQISIYQLPLDEAIHQSRKQVLTGIGGALLLFGLALVWVLNRLITRPFQAMVQVAQRFSQGRTELRFDTGRGDEFGYLGGFINGALDHLLWQQDQVTSSLESARRSEAALFAEKERMEVTLHSIADGVVTTDRDGMIRYVNPAAEALLGVGAGDLRGRRITEALRVVDEASRRPVQDRWCTLCLQRGTTADPSENSLLLRADGTELHIADSAAPIRDRDGEVIGAIIVIRDVGQTRKLARELSYQAAHDGLTGLLNRTAFERQIEAAIDDTREGREHVLCYLDLDQFKIVNDTCGHVAGDEVLIQIAQLLKSQVRDSDVVARLGGDEFGVILRSCDLLRAQAVADKLRDAIRTHRFVWETHAFECGACIGMAAINDPAQTLTDLLSAVDVACYAAKDEGRDRIHVFEPDDAELSRRRGEMHWVARIRSALDEDRFVLYAQPIQCLRTSGAARHYEVLIRMLDEQGELVPPIDFIPAAERYNLMGAIDRWVIESTLRILSRQSCPTTQLAINLSGQSMGDTELVDFIVSTIDTTGVDPARLCFEITETAAVSNLHQATRMIADLKSAGCRFALDDFGAGLSSFAYLKNLPVDYLKIDGSFVRDIRSDPIHRAMVESINQIGHVMGLMTIAEFVEDFPTLQILREIGVDNAQGYAIARPAPLTSVFLEPAAGAETL